MAKSTHPSAAVRNWEDKQMVKLSCKDWIEFSNEFDFRLSQEGTWPQVSAMIDEVASLNS